MPPEGAQDSTPAAKRRSSALPPVSVMDTCLDNSYLQTSIRQQPTRLSDIDEESNSDPSDTINDITSELENDSDGSSWEEIPTPTTETEGGPAMSPQVKEFKSTQISPGDRPLPTEGDYNSLHEAIVDGDIKAVKAKLVSPIRMCLERERDDGFTPLVIAIMEGHVTITRMLLKARVDVHHRVGTLLPIVHAIMKKQRAPQLIQLLLDHGANPNFVCGKAQMNALQWAVEEGMIDAADFLISKGMDLNARCSKGRTPLILAAERGHLVVVKLLLAQGADLLQKSQNGGTALTWAACNGHLDTVKYLIDEGINVDDADNNALTALSMASNFGRLQVVEHLITKGADVNHLNDVPKGVTPVMAAAIGGHTEVVEFLVRHDANLKIPNGYGDTVLEAAMNEGHINTVKFLLRTIGGPEHAQESVALEMAMADSRDTIQALMSTASMMYPYFETQAHGEFAWLDWVLASGGELVKSRAMFHMLYSALNNDQLDLVRALFKHGCDLNTHLASGHTPLSFAVRQGDLELVRILLDAGADPAKPACGPGGVNLTPLHQAIMALEDDREKDTSTIDALLESGRCKVLEGKRFSSTVFAYVLENFDLWENGLAEILVFRMLEYIRDVNSDRCSDGSTLLHVAVHYSHKDLIDILLERGADINAINNLGQTPFLLKCRCLPEILPWLLKRGADPFLKDKGGRSGLHMAADSGKLHTLKSLLRTGLDINTITSDGDTPLICALTVRQEDTALFLMDQGANYQIKCLTYQRTIVHYAAALGLEKVIERVLQSGDVDINAKDAAGWTALGLACRKGSTKLVQTLIAAGADMESVEEANDRPLHMSLINGNEDVAIHLIEQGVDVCASGSYDRTALHLAAAYGNSRAAQLILHRDITTEALDDLSRTPLSICNDPVIVRHLLDHGANVNHADQDGWTPLHHTITSRNLKVFKLLLRGGADPYARTGGDGMNIRDRIGCIDSEYLYLDFEDALDEEIFARKAAYSKVQDEKGYEMS